MNFSKGGISTTIGGRGLTTTMGRGRVTNTVGIPGTGISYSSTAREAPPSKSPSVNIATTLGLLALALGATNFTNLAPTAGTVFCAIGCFLVLPALVRLRRRVSNVNAAHVMIDNVAHEDLNDIADKFRVLLFLARDDGAVRANERDLIAGYLRTQPGAEDVTDAWLKEMHSKVTRDPIEMIEVMAARLGQAGRIDDELVNAAEALVKLSKVVSPSHARTLSALRHERDICDAGRSFHATGPASR